jgi:hypothetical protein
MATKFIRRIEKLAVSRYTPHHTEMDMNRSAVNTRATGGKE